MMNNSEWLSNFYNRIQNDCIVSIRRRDRITTWSYALLAAVITAYVGFFADGNFVSPLGRYALVSGVLFVLIRFFFQSMIAYGYFLRARYLRTKIEQFWMNQTPTLKDIQEDITTFDHGRTMPITERNRLSGQIKSGFLLILVIAAIPLAIEFYLNLFWEYFAIAGGLAAYALFETYNFKRYDQMQSAKI